MEHHFPSRSPWRKVFPCFGLYALIFWLVAMSSCLLADGTSVVHAPSPPPSASGEDFGQYLAAHQEDLAPFFEKHSDDLVKQGLPLLLEVLGNIILLNMVIGWVFDIGISFGFSSLFAPAYAKIKKAVIYATGRLFLGLIVGILAGLVCLGVGLMHSLILILAAIILMVLVDLVIQTFLVIAIYRTSIVVSGLFYLCLLVVHLLAGALVLGPLIKVRVATMMTQFIDKNVTSQLKSTTAEAKQDLALVAEARDKVKAEQTDAQNQLDQANADLEKIHEQIEERKNSEAFVYGRIVKVHAQGDLPAARDQFVAFLAQFPSGTETEAARAQLAQVNSELATQEAQKKQDEADALRVAEQARADLLARAGKGEVTLSEMRQALIGKRRDEVSALLGQPSEIGSDRWGYAQRMIFNPMTNQQFGLAIYFNEGTVLSVDYYYGGGGVSR